jgi:hypothetical protein
MSRCAACETHEQGRRRQYLSATFRPLLAVYSSPVSYGEALRIGATFRLAWYDSPIVASRSKVSVTLFTVQIFRMDSRLET